MPPVSYGRWIIESLFEMGPVIRTSGGIDPVPHAEIRAWSDGSGARITEWEHTTMRKMCEAYARQCAVADQPDAEAPWSSEPVERKSYSEQVAESFRGHRDAKKQPKHARL